MSALQLLAFLLVGAGGTLVAFTREPRRQVLMLSLYGITLAVLFMVLQAPDVAFSEIAVGVVATPALLLMTLAGTSRPRTKQDEQKPADEEKP